MEENEKLENSLFETLTDNTVELSSEIGEFTIDQFIDNDILKEIPFFSIFYKSFKTVQGLREALFAMKVYKFIKEFDQIKQNETDELLLKISSDNKEKTRIGQTLIMMLDKIDDLDKTQIIANVFTAYIKLEITRSEFMQLCSIIQNAYLEHLLLFNKMKSYNELDIEIQCNLSSFGLMMPLITSLLPIKDEYSVVYVVSKIGMKMKKYAFKSMAEI